MRGQEDVALAPAEAPAIATQVLDFSVLPRARLQAMRAAGEEVLECVRVLEKADLNIVGEVLRGCGTFYEDAHYPPDDVIDRATHSQYYYHAHRGSDIEHGHFHTFLRAGAIPPAVEPAPYHGAGDRPLGDQAISHLVAVSMDGDGRPIGLFCVNRWVTAETWYAAEDVIAMLDRFAIDHAGPSWPVNRWIGAMLRLFRPQIELLLRQRDEVVRARARAHPETDVYEDRALEITGAVEIGVEQQIAAVHAALLDR